MLQSNKGFFLLELLLSLSALLMLSLYLLPLLMELREQAQQLEVNRIARRLMYEELQAKLTNNQTFSNYTIIVDKVQYKIKWDIPGSDHQREVCVTVEKSSIHPETNVCGILE